VSTPVLKYLFSIDDYYRMAEAGILPPDSRVELIRGEVVEMSPLNAPHAECVDQLARMFSRSVADRARIRVQNPIQIPPHSHPQPDLVLAKVRPEGYRDRHPEPQEVLLLIEVCHTSLAYDRDVKVPLYAEAGIPEVWLVDLNERKVTVYSAPEENGYGKTTEVSSGGSLTPGLLSGIELAVDSLLG
jgi:Uma2 family endonuclease